ncbi:MAG: 50S ribosomal protein L18 [Gemmatimonadota bacterium]|nr:MAG: 50S ribosomal protein L18 [Gemmatimonadota bacterium]
MRPILKPKTNRERRYRRHLRVRKSISGTAQRPRLAVFRSLKHTYAQLVDDDGGKTLIGVSDLSKDLLRDKPGKVGAAYAVGLLVGKKAGELGIKSIVFDRGGYLYHGRVKAVADGARASGLEF